MEPKLNSSETAKFALSLKGLFFTRYLWIAYGIILVLLGSALGVGAWYGQKQIAASAAAETHSIAVALGELNRRQIQTMAIPLDYFASEVTRKGGLEKLKQTELDSLIEFTRTTLHRSEVRDVFAIDKEGNVLNQARSPVSGRRVNYRSHSDFEYVKTQKNPTVLSSMVSSRDHKNVLVLMQSLRTQNGRFAGIIGVTRSFDEFETFYKSLELHFPISFAMLRDDGKILYRYPADDHEFGPQVRFTRNLEADSEGIMDIKSVNSNEETVGYYKFASEHGSMIFVGYNVDHVFANWRTAVKLGIALFLVSMALLALLVRLAQRRQETVEKLVEAHRHRDNLIRQIQQPTEIFTGADFLKELVIQVCKVLEVNNAVVGLILPEHTDAVKCVVNCVNGEFSSNQVYSLRKTPFRDLNPGEFFMHLKSTSNMYPEDTLLGHQKVESSLGFVLQNSKREAIGILMVYSEEPMPEITLKRSILSVFASRAGAELDRVHTDELRHEVESLRKQIEERSLQSKKMEAIGSLAESLAHDFNNILAIILASTEKMLNLHKQSTQDEHYLGSIKKACHRARHLVSQISVFSQKEESGEQIKTTIDEVFNETLYFLKSVLPDNIGVSLNMAECQDLEIMADPDQLQQALMNLCLNASKYIGVQGGEVRLNLQKNRIRGKLYVKCIVHHSGEEMGREEIEKIFNPFYAQNIGMVLVQRIITNHQGFIEIKSEAGQGTDYEIFLPVLESNAISLARKSYQLKTEKKVLIVDDEPEIGLLIKELLEIEGLQVNAETDPIKALQEFKDYPEKYFMIISDLAMPEMSGFEFCRCVREVNPNIPLILWSGYYQYLDQELQDLNVKVLSKPVDVQKLLQMINAEVSQLSAQDTLRGVVSLGSAPSVLT
jgi:signal transduction histidine kinase/ActR/RegA family two-component response regulator